METKKIEEAREKIMESHSSRLTSIMNNARRRVLLGGLLMLGGGVYGGVVGIGNGNRSFETDGSLRPATLIPYQLSPESETTLSYYEELRETVSELEGSVSGMEVLRGNFENDYFGKCEPEDLSSSLANYQGSLASAVNGLSEAKSSFESSPAYDTLISEVRAADEKMKRNDMTTFMIVLAGFGLGFGSIGYSNVSRAKSLRRRNQELAELSSE